MPEHGDGHHTNYVKTYIILLVLFAVSVAGPEIAPVFGGAATIVVLITAFGIAFVKAYLVCRDFMHLTVEKSIAQWFLVTALAFMVMLFAGTAPDVMKDEGTNWVKTTEIEWHETSEAYRAKHPDGHHGSHEGNAAHPTDEAHSEPEAGHEDGDHHH